VHHVAFIYKITKWRVFTARCALSPYTVCLTRHFFNNSNTNEDIATKFERCVLWCRQISYTMRQARFKFRCNILISGKIIKEMPGSVVSGTPCITQKHFVLKGLMIIFISLRWPRCKYKILLYIPREILTTQCTSSPSPQRLIGPCTVSTVLPQFTLTYSEQSIIIGGKKNLLKLQQICRITTASSRTANVRTARHTTCPPILSVGADSLEQIHSSALLNVRLITGLYLIFFITVSKTLIPCRDVSPAIKMHTVTAEETLQPVALLFATQPSTNETQWTKYTYLLKSKVQPRTGHEGPKGE
jgi:hypothetical protein